MDADGGEPTLRVSFAERYKNPPSLSPLQPEKSGIQREASQRTPHPTPLLQRSNSQSPPGNTPRFASHASALGFDRYETSKAGVAGQSTQHASTLHSAGTQRATAPASSFSGTRKNELGPTDVVHHFHTPDGRDTVLEVNQAGTSQRLLPAGSPARQYIHTDSPLSGSRSPSPRAADGVTTEVIRVPGATPVYHHHYAADGGLFASPSPHRARSSGRLVSVSPGGGRGAFADASPEVIESYLLKQCAAHAANIEVLTNLWEQSNRRLPYQPPTSLSPEAGSRQRSRSPLPAYD
ncbi:hypothetical protein DIPPA_00964 [Diplonema papillatum]|nr:hypothetical protein DIPPA_00964 [Diplonema papillatum]|eukprot:gene2354-3650_t